jgi:RimJ/RimL family protein N-acetyltransferase
MMVEPVRVDNESIAITGARVVLRDPIPGDVDVLAYWLQPDHRWQELDGPLTGMPDPEQREAILRERRDLVTSRGWPVPRTNLSIASLDTGEMLGQVTWAERATDTEVTQGLSIVIYNPDMWGYGLGFEALGLWVDYLFGAAGSLPALELRTWSRNQGMVRLAQKLGFEEVTPGRRRFGLFTQRQDVVGFTMTREHWIERFPRGFAAELGGREE